jgi:hypothetical protein
MNGRGFHSSVTLRWRNLTKTFRSHRFFVDSQITEPYTGVSLCRVSTVAVECSSFAPCRECLPGNGRYGSPQHPLGYGLYESNLGSPLSVARLRPTWLPRAPRSGVPFPRLFSRRPEWGRPLFRRAVIACGVNCIVVAVPFWGRELASVSMVRACVAGQDRGTGDPETFPVADIPPAQASFGSGIRGCGPDFFSQRFRRNVFFSHRLVRGTSRRCARQWALRVTVHGPGRGTGTNFPATVRPRCLAASDVA